MILLNVHNLTYRYPGHSTLDNVSLTVRAGESVGITGPSNSAKSMILKCIAGVREITSGTICFKTRPIHLFSPETRIELGILRVPGVARLCPLMTTEETLEAGAFSIRTCRRIAEMFDRVFTLLPRLFRIRRTQIINLTADEQYMVSLGRALMADPKLLLLDKPPLNDSSPLFAELSYAIDTVRSGGTSILASVPETSSTLTHFDRRYTMNDGRADLDNLFDGQVKKRKAA